MGGLNLSPTLEKTIKKLPNPRTLFKCSGGRAKIILDTGGGLGYKRGMNNRYIADHIERILEGPWVLERKITKLEELARVIRMESDIGCWNPDEGYSD